CFRPAAGRRHLRLPIRHYAGGPRRWRDPDRSVVMGAVSESRRRSAGGLALALGVLILSLGAAAAAPSQDLREPQELVPDPPRLFTVDVTPLEGPRGTVIVATGRCMWDADRGIPASRVLVSSVPRAMSIDDVAHQHYASQDRLGGDGAFRVELTVPHEVPPGEYLLSASCSSEDQVFAFTDV